MAEKDPKLRYIASPYNLKETLGWFKRNYLGVSKKNRNIVKSIPNHHILNDKIAPKYSIAFIGDIMDMNKKNLVIGDKLKEFIKDCDYCVGNFEATITEEKGAFMAQHHISQILDALSILFKPERTFLSLANNHAGDFGREIFTKSINEIKSHGFKIFGVKDNPFVDINNEIRIIGGTMWSNQKCNYIVKFEETSQYINPDFFNILYPHWSYELELFPRPKIVKIGNDLINKFDAIIGHHSHCPQPLTSVRDNNYNINKLVGYGLGDFCIWEKLEHYFYGIVLKIEIGENENGLRQIGEINWEYTKCTPKSENEWVTEIIENFAL